MSDLVNVSKVESAFMCTDDLNHKSKCLLWRSPGSLLKEGMTKEFGMHRFTVTIGCLCNTVFFYNSIIVLQSIKW